MSFRKVRAQDLAQRYGSQPSEIQDLQSHGVLEPRQDKDGFYYTPRDEVRLQIALKSLRLGFTMREIAAMIAIVAGLSIASLMIHTSSLCRICLKTGAPYVAVFDHTVI